MICVRDGCSKQAETGSDECFRHRVMGVGITYKGGALPGRTGWNRSRADWMTEHLGTTNEKELAAQGLVRADKL